MVVKGEGIQRGFCEGLFKYSGGDILYIGLSVRGVCVGGWVGVSVLCFLCLLCLFLCLPVSVLAALMKVEETSGERPRTP